MKSKQISKLNSNVIIVIQALHKQKEYITEFELFEIVKDKITNNELKMVIRYLKDKGSILVLNSTGSDGAELPIPTYRLSFEMFLLIEKLKDEDKKTVVKKTLTKDWIKSKPEMSVRLKSALLIASEAPEYKMKNIEDITKDNFFKIRSLGKHSWNEFRRLTGNI